MSDKSEGKRPGLGATLSDLFGELGETLLDIPGFADLFGGNQPEPSRPQLPRRLRVGDSTFTHAHSNTAITRDALIVLARADRVYEAVRTTGTIRLRKVAENELVFLARVNLQDVLYVLYIEDRV